MINQLRQGNQLIKISISDLQAASKEIDEIIKLAENPYNLYKLGNDSNKVLNEKMARVQLYFWMFSNKFEALQGFLGKKEGEE